MNDALDDCDRGWHCSIVLDGFFYSEGCLFVVGVGETVGDDGGFESDDGLASGFGDLDSVGHDHDAFAPGVEAFFGGFGAHGSEGEVAF